MHTQWGSLFHIKRILMYRFAIWWQVLFAPLLERQPVTNSISKNLTVNENSNFNDYLSFKQEIDARVMVLLSLLLLLHDVIVIFEWNCYLFLAPGKMSAFGYYFNVCFLDQISWRHMSNRWIVVFKVSWLSCLISFSEKGETNWSIPRCSDIKESLPVFCLNYCWSQLEFCSSS